MLYVHELSDGNLTNISETVLNLDVSFIYLFVYLLTFNLIVLIL